MLTDGELLPRWAAECRPRGPSAPRAVSGRDCRRRPRLGAPRRRAGGSRDCKCLRALATCSDMYRIQMFLIYTCICMFLSIHLHIYLSTCVCIYPFTHPSIHVCLSSHLHIYLSICVHLSIYISMCLSIHLYIHLSMCMSIYPFTYLSIHV